MKQAFGLSAEAVREQLQSRLGLRIKLASLSSTVMERVLKHQWSGMNYSERIWKSMDALQTTLKDVMTDGLLSGSSLDDMALEISDRMGVALSNARRLVRTESTYVNNQVALESYKQAGLDQYEYVTAKDERVCAVCGPLNTQRFKVSEAVIGENLPPMHPNCRCSTIAVVDGTTHTQTAVQSPATDSALTRLIDLNADNIVRESSVEMNPVSVNDELVQTIGRLNPDIYKVVNTGITTDEVVLTSEQRRHIVQRHPDSADQALANVALVVADPDYILQDDAYATAVILKEIQQDGEKLRIILRLATAADEKGLKNSVITAFTLSLKKWRRYLRQKKVIYSRSGI
ncbi:hypothetical protein FACS1894184_18270 [Clostridia bacterium]|nr:hypothetical protein FACS1894184_18270 [Clostridia bacterium]